MGVLITSGDRLGLRALGSGGRTALSSYDQIIRTLGETMGAEHVALFAEPSLRGPAIDWYTNFDATGATMRMREAGPAAREAARSRLESLVDDIAARATVLQQSDREGDRILGEMLQYALQVPSEDSVWLVDGQPVLAFWGHVRDQGQPAENPLRTLIQRRPPGSGQGPSTGTGTTPTFVEAVADPGRSAQASEGTVAVLAPRSMLAVALWTIFTMLLVTIGVTLLHACGLGFTGALTGSFLNYCPVAIDPRVDQERERQAALQAEYDDLIRQTELKRQACVLVPKATPPPVVAPPVSEPPAVQPPPATPKKDDALVIPDEKDKKSDDYGFLKGCWRSDHGITAVENDKDTGKPLVITYCFGDGGNGTRTIKYENETKTCRGGLHAHRDGDMLVIEMDSAVCDDKSSYVPATDTCKAGDTGEARCDEISKGETQPRITNHRFLKE